MHFIWTYVIPYNRLELIAFEATHASEPGYFPQFLDFNILFVSFSGSAANESHVGRWYVKNIKPTPAGEPQELKIKVRINANGVISLTSANLVEKKLKEDIPIDNGNGETNNMEVGQEVCMHCTLFPLEIYQMFRFILWNPEREHK